MRAIVLVTSIFISLFVNSQDIKQEIIKLNKNAVKDPNIAVEIITKVYQDNKPSPIKESKATMYKMPGKYLYKDETVESMANGNYKIDVNHYTKLITINKITKRAPHVVTSESTFEKKEFNSLMDTLFTLYKDVEIKPGKDDSNEMVFKMKDGRYDLIKVIYNKKSYQISSMFIKARYDKEMKHEYSCLMVYNYLDKKLLNDKKFSESNYVNMKDKKMTPSSQLSAYQVIDYSNKKG
jgi:hypothetical protein